MAPPAKTRLSLLGLALLDGGQLWRAGVRPKKSAAACRCRHHGLLQDGFCPLSFGFLGTTHAQLLTHAIVWRAPHRQSYDNTTFVSMPEAMQIMAYHYLNSLISKD